MSYRRERSRLVVGMGAGLGAWLAGTVLIGALLWVTFGAAPGGSPLELAAAYPIAVLWFVAVVTGEVTPLVLAAGAATTGLLVGGGVLAAVVADLRENPYDGIGLGLAVAAGHALGVAVVMAWVGPVGIAARGAAGRTFTLAFGGFVVPAALAVVGAVGAVQFRG